MAEVIKKHDILGDRFLDEFHRKVQEPVWAIPTHLPTLNRICRGGASGRGLGAGTFLTIGGAAGAGKSAFSLSLASSALRHGIPGGVAMINLEMDAHQTATRMYSIYTNTRISRLEHGDFELAYFQQARKAMQGSQPLWVPDGLLASLEECLEYMNSCKDESGCRYFIVDYLQLIHSAGRDEDSILKQTQRTVTALRAWGLQNEAIIICLSQFNRSATSNQHESRTPSMHQMFGGGLIEQSSTMCAVLDHSRYIRNGNEAYTYFCVQKNRAGPAPMEIPIHWNYRDLSCREMDEDEEIEVFGAK